MFSKSLAGDTFFFDIEKMVKEGGASYLDAILKWTKDNEMEAEAVAELIEKYPIIKARLTMEAEDLNLLKRQGHLPI